MELNWSTFFLEIMNFLVLVWVLHHFLYRPVLGVVEKRRQKINVELAQAAAGQREASALKNQYEARLADWEQEKRAAFDDLEQQLAQERGKRMRQMDDDLEKQRLKNRARDQHRQAQWRSQAEAEALHLGGAFASRVLSGLAGPEMDQRLQQLFIDELGALPESALRELREDWENGASRIEVVSAAPLDSARQGAIRQALEEKLGPSDGPWQFTRDEKLIAGLRVSIGGWILGANLQDELRFFSEAASSHEPDR